MGCSVGIGCGFVRGSQASSLPPLSLLVKWRFLFSFFQLPTALFLV